MANFSSFILSAIRLSSANLKNWGEKLSTSNSTWIKKTTTANGFSETLGPGCHLSGGYFLCAYRQSCKQKLVKKRKEKHIAYTNNMYVLAHV